MKVGKKVVLDDGGFGVDTIDADVIEMNRMESLALVHAIKSGVGVWNVSGVTVIIKPMPNDGSGTHNAIEVK